MKSLLASHGSLGAKAAEKVAIASCKSGDQLDHLYVIPSWWADMTGDDWLNNGASRNSYRHYLERELEKESLSVINRIRDKCEKKKISYKSILLVGNCEQLLQKYADNYSKVFVGSCRPKTIEGLNDKMLTNKVLNKLKDQLEIIQFPHG